ncbi:hypothetical protein [Microbacterium deminutum]|uniref:AMMECR1 domain-containing protein n=1 Tax=Microbacterium deminutum TaxID=344164 RepID=A0ABP5BY34_9MICO
MTAREAGGRRAELLAAIRRDGILHADESTRIVGRAGESASWMLYCWPLTTTASGAALIGDVLVDALAGFEATQVAAYGFGAMPLMSACVLRGGGRYTGLAVRPEAKKHGNLRVIDGVGDKSRKVVLVDDSISSGISFTQGAAALESQGYEVEGSVCLVDFSRRGGAERARARGYHLETVYDIWDDLGMPRPDRPPLYLRCLPERWADEAVPDGLHPGRVARLVAEHLVDTGEVLRPPGAFAEPEHGPGGVWVSFRRISDDKRFAREGFWHFDPDDADPERDVVIATARAVQKLGPQVTRDWLTRLKLCVTFFSAVERIEPRDLDFRRYGIVARSTLIPAKMGGALPNTQLFTSSVEQYRHARVRNAKIGTYEPHTLYRHDVIKRPEPGQTWPAYGEDERITDAWAYAPGLGEALTRRVREVITAHEQGSELAGTPLPQDLVDPSVTSVAVSLYSRGLIGCSVSGRGTLDDLILGATRYALADRRFATRRTASGSVETVAVTLLHDREYHGAVSVEHVAWKMRAGKDALMVREGSRWAVFLESVLSQFDITKEQVAKDLLAKAGITDGSPTWSTYKATSWATTGDRTYPLEFGGRRRDGTDRVGAGDLEDIVTHLLRRLDHNGWPAYSISAKSATFQRTGTAARCLHALQAIAAAGMQAGRADWREAALPGVRFALDHLGADHVLRLPGHEGGPIADAMLLSAAVDALPADEAGERAGPIADRLASWVLPDGMLLDPTATRATAEQDYLPGIALLALVHCALATGRDIPVDWASVRRFYARRFEQVHPWGLAGWHTRLWPLVTNLTGDDTYNDFAASLGDWICERQLRADGSYLTDVEPSGPGLYTAFVAEGLSGAWQGAVNSGDDEHAARFAEGWRAAMGFVDRLLVRPDDAYWAPLPELIVGGVRNQLTRFGLRVDATSHALQALLGGLAADAGPILPPTS